MGSSEGVFPVGGRALSAAAILACDPGGGEQVPWVEGLPGPPDTSTTDQEGGACLLPPMLQGVGPPPSAAVGVLCLSVASPAFSHTHILRCRS